MNRFLIFKINKIESINWRQYENIQIFQSIDSFFISTHSLLIIFSHNREITLLVDRQINRIRRIEFYREKDKKIEFNKSANSILIKFTYLSTSSRFVIVLTIMTHSSQSSSFLKIRLIFEIVELMMKDIFDIVLIRRLMRQQRINEVKNEKWDIQSINKRFWVIERSSACRALNCRILLIDERMNC
jgi:hypothetical protein